MQHEGDSAPNSNCLRSLGNSSLTNVMAWEVNCGQPDNFAYECWMSGRPRELAYPKEVPDTLKPKAWRSPCNQAYTKSGASSHPVWDGSMVYILKKQRLSSLRCLTATACMCVCMRKIQQLAPLGWHLSQLKRVIYPTISLSLLSPLSVLSSFRPILGVMLVR